MVGKIAGQCARRGQLEQHSAARPLAHVGVDQLQLPARERSRHLSRNTGRVRIVSIATTRCRGRSTRREVQLPLEPRADLEQAAALGPRELGDLVAQAL